MLISRHLLRQDCAPGTCYEGACPGDKMYSTDGTCGDQYGGRICAGIWGDCCNFNGTCGTGTAFCATDSCQSGNCTWAISPPTPPDWSYGNSTDGTCGAANSTSCGSLWGNCCNQRQCLRISPFGLRGWMVSLILNLSDGAVVFFESMLTWYIVNRSGGRVIQ